MDVGKRSQKLNIDSNGQYLPAQNRGIPFICSLIYWTDVYDHTADEVTHGGLWNHLEWVHLLTSPFLCKLSAGAMRAWSCRLPCLIFCYLFAVLIYSGPTGTKPNNFPDLYSPTASLLPQGKCVNTQCQATRGQASAHFTWVRFRGLWEWSGRPSDRRLLPYRTLSCVYGRPVSTQGIPIKLEIAQVAVSQLSCTG